MLEADQLSPRRRLLVDAAIEVVAAHGLRGLTHRAVDRQAGLPEGSCSAYLRTRHAMISALGSYVASRLTTDVRALRDQLAGCTGDHERAVELTSELFLRWLDARALLVAKLELTMEATRDPQLAAVFTTWRSELVDAVDGILEQAGRDRGQNRSATLVAALDGVLMGALLQPATRRRPYVEESVALLLGAVTGHEESHTVAGGARG
ncbi:TetR/AcrR family transcriptional regulator [Nocardioides guangzhouensis]|uniref:TetR/AcrR family transcriptional regulator n=1 Tax=Nocardioides guangzhouensis TaxID=2497878 RepID=A0A4Q4ZND6_9ACTN|nr:TetR/AcrR family transcriptional regulator [Nocardioides guangzhouensis]RYP89004.1 TetR/AcrR family transcriptional regulator [Nocardioides guangzhouensis]